MVFYLWTSLLSKSTHNMLDKGTTKFEKSAVCRKGMTSNSPPTRRRRQSIGTLQVTDTKTIHHPTWPDNESNPNDDSNQPNPGITTTPDTTHQSLGQSSSPSPHTNHFTVSGAATENKTPFDDDDDDNSNNNNNITKKSKKGKVGVQFRQQMSWISNVSQLTLNLTCKEKYISWRYAIATLLHFIFFTAILMRNCMPIALVCMTDPSPKEDSSACSDNGTLCKEMSRNESDTEHYEFHWDLNTQSLILSGVQFSSCVGPLICDMLRVRIGSKHTMSLCTLAAAVLTILSPVGARVSPWVLFTIRVLLGLFLGANVSATADLLSWWAPASEKQTMTSFAFAGTNFGGMITTLVAGFLCSIPLDGGWPFIFYVFGFLSIAMTVVWHFMNANKPEDHRFISESEVDFIMNYRTPIQMGPKGKPEKPPYKRIFTSIPVLGYFASSASQVWTTSLYFTVMPNFLVTVPKFTVEETGIIMSMVSLARFFGIPIWTMVINGLRKRSVSNTRTKKIVLATGYSTAAILQVAVLFLDDYEYRWVTVSLFLVILACQVAGMCVFTVLPMDMAPRYAGFLSGVFYSFGSLLSISAPMMVAALAPNSTREEWRIIWIIVSAVYAVAVVIFSIFGDASVQPWARIHRDSRPNIQSAFVSMGRRISAVLDGPISSNSPAVRGSRDFTFTSAINGVSMTPNGSENSLPNQEAENISSQNVNSRMSSPPNQIYENFTPATGVSNPSFVHEEGPGMIDKVTAPTTILAVEEDEVDSLEQRYAKEKLDYIDDPVDTAEEDAQQQITRL